MKKQQQQGKVETETKGHLQPKLSAHGAAVRLALPSAMAPQLVSLEEAWARYPFGVGFKGKPQEHPQFSLGCCSF